MKKVFGILLLLLLFLFCLYGALASREPGVHTGWLVGYSVVGIVSLAASMFLFRSKSE